MEYLKKPEVESLTEASRGSLSIEVGRSITAEDVVDILTSLFSATG